MTTLTDEDVDLILERFDLTDPQIQRETMANLVKRLGELQAFKDHFEEVLVFVHDVTLSLQRNADATEQRQMFQRAYRLYCKWQCDKNNGDDRFTLRTTESA